MERASMRWVKGGWDRCWRSGLLAGLFLLGGLGAAAAREQTLPAGVAGETGLLWRIEQPGGGKASYLFGTIHSEDPRVTTLPATVQESLAHAQQFVMEVEPDPTSMLAASQSMLLPEGQSLRSLLGQDLFRQVMRAMLAYGQPEEAVDRMKPWAAMVTLSMPKPRTGLVLDVLLYMTALQSGKQVAGLETAQEQLDIFDKLPQDEQITLLTEALQQLTQLDSMMAKMHEAYLARNLAELSRLSELYGNTGDTALTRKMNTALIDQRNLRMAQRMQPMLRQGNAFIAVGALHLPGPQGLLSLLRQRGYRVTAVY